MDPSLVLSFLLIIISSVIGGNEIVHAGNGSTTETSAIDGLEAMPTDASDADITTASSDQETEQSEVEPLAIRSRRSLFGFRSMMLHALNCDRPLSYSGYGCYCGSGGDGTPIDGIDACCMQHDHCYSRSGCGGAVAEYTTSYAWDYVYGGVTCDARRNSGCAQALCQCDKMFVECQSRQGVTCPRGKNFCTSSAGRAIQNFGFNVFEFAGGVAKDTNVWGQIGNKAPQTPGDLINYYPPYQVVKNLPPVKLWEWISG